MCRVESHLPKTGSEVATILAADVVHAGELAHAELRRRQRDEHLRREAVLGCGHFAQEQRGVTVIFRSE